MAGVNPSLAGRAYDTLDIMSSKNILLSFHISTRLVCRLDGSQSRKERRATAKPRNRTAEKGTAIVTRCIRSRMLLSPPARAQRESPSLFCSPGSVIRPKIEREGFVLSLVVPSDLSSRRRSRTRVDLRMAVTNDATSKTCASRSRYSVAKSGARRTAAIR